MNKNTAFSLFEELIKTAQEELVKFTLASPLSIDKKADKSLVTECDKVIDQKLTEIAQSHGLQVVSEEGEHVKDMVKSGNYITIDPIDGTLGYIDYVNKAVELGDITSFLKTNLGPEHDFSLLLGIVEDAQPRFAACFNYVTKEKILVDALDKRNLIRENNLKNYTQKFAIYSDPRFLNDPIVNKLLSLPEVTSINQATFGLKSIYTILNPHQAAITLHRVQAAGLWDVLPAAVAAKAFGGHIYDDNGDILVLNDYIVLPGNGAAVIKGDMFQFVVEDLRKSTSNL